MSDGEEATVNRLLEDDGTAVEPSSMDDISQERDSDSPPAESGSLLDDATVTGASSTELRAAKSQAKGDFIRLRRGFLVKLNIGELGQGEVLKHMFAEVEAAHDRLNSVILDLVGWYSQRRDTQVQANSCFSSFAVGLGPWVLSYEHFLTGLSHLVEVQHRKQPADRLPVYKNESIHKYVWFLRTVI